jgi:hypothetical protein
LAGPFLQVFLGDVVDGLGLPLGAAVVDVRSAGVRALSPKRNL